MIWLVAVAFAEDPAPNVSAVPPVPVPTDQLTTALISLLTAAAAVASREGFVAGRRRWGGGDSTAAKVRDHERRLDRLEEGQHYHGNTITGLCAHTHYDPPPRRPPLPDPPSGDSGSGEPG